MRGPQTLRAVVSYRFFFFLLLGRKKGLGCRGGEEQGPGGQPGMGQSGRLIGPLQRHEGSLNSDAQSAQGKDILSNAALWAACQVVSALSPEGKKAGLHSREAVIDGDLRAQGFGPSPRSGADLESQQNKAFCRVGGIPSCLNA